MGLLTYNGFDQAFVDGLKHIPEMFMPLYLNDAIPDLEVYTEVIQDAVIERPLRWDWVLFSMQKKCLLWLMAIIKPVPWLRR